MKKALALLVVVSLIFGAMTVVFADKRGSDENRDHNTPKVTVTPKASPTVTPESKEKKHSCKTKKIGKFTYFTGTTTAKAHLRILVSGKTVAAGLADSKGNFSIKVETKKLKGTATVYAYIVVRTEVPVVLAPSATPAPSATVVPTTTATPVPSATATPAPSATATPAPSATAAA